MPQPGDTVTRLHIAQMDCPTEEGLLRKALGTLGEVHGLRFNLLERMLSVTHAPGALPKIEAAIRALGMTPEALAEALAEAPGAAPGGAGWPWSLTAAAVAALVAEGAQLAGLSPWFAGAASLVSVALCGLGVYRKGWIALRHGQLNINALMSIAVTGAMVLGQWPEAAMVMVLFSLAERIEALSLERARHAIHGLLLLTPPSALVQGPDGAWSQVEARAVQLGARVRVGPGESIPLDGEIVEGRSAVNQAPITGESLPVDKAPGDTVFAGTLNLTGSFVFRVTAKADGTTLARITHAIEEAQATKAPIQRLVDRFAQVYTPGVLGLALAVALVPPLVLGGAWGAWCYRALVMLVIACPCALVISTPVTIISGLAAATRHGILIKGGRYLEEGRKLIWLAFDKTGTLTCGEPSLTDFVALVPISVGEAAGSAVSCVPGKEGEQGLSGHRQREPDAAGDADDRAPGRLPNRDRHLSAQSEAELWMLATSLASRSDHPVSRALVKARPGAVQAGVEDFTALPGLGVQGRVAGITYSLGNHHLVEDLGVCSPALEARLEALETEGKTTLMLSDGQTVLALFALADAVKPTSRAAMAELHALGIRTLMLTGDNAHTARAIAAQVGIDEVRGDQLPEDKARAIREKLGPLGKVGMVGDGINDGPALACADLGFAMGAAGSDTAIETADVALMDDDLGKLATFIRLSRATHRVLVQNLALAVGIKAAFLALTVLGRGTMWMAVFADMGASLLVIFNGLRLLRK